MTARGAARGAGFARWGVLRSVALAARASVRPGAPSWRERLAAVPRMVRAAVRGDYPALSLSRLAGLAAAVLYVLSPVDLVPEGLLAVLGLADDAMLVTWLATSLVNDTEAFLAWERGTRRGAAPQDAPPPADAAWSGTPGPYAAPVTVRSHVVR